MKKQLAIATIAALAGWMFASPSANAQAYSSDADGNMFLGFYQTGVATDYLVYIGSYTNYTTAGGAYTGSQITLNTAPGIAIGTNTQIANDLQSIFGVNWATTVKWGVVGDYDYLGANTVFITDPLATTSTHWTSNSADNQGIVTGETQNLDSYYGTLSSGSATAANAKTQSSSATGSYYYYTPSGANSPGTSFSIYGSDFNATGVGSLKLDELTATDASSNGNPLRPDGTGVVLGTFTLGSDGTITYAAIPEPTTYAMIGLGFLLLVAMGRRRRALAE